MSSEIVVLVSSIESYKKCAVHFMVSGSYTMEKIGTLQICVIEVSVSSMGFSSTNTAMIFRIHSLKYQSIVFPDGILWHLWCPEIGRRYDCWLLYRCLLLSSFAAPNN